MRFHACDFLTVDVATAPSKLLENTIGVMDASAEEGCRPESAPEPNAFTVLPLVPFSEYPVASDWFAGLNGGRFILVRHERSFFTSDCLLGLMAAPVVLLLTRLERSMESWRREAKILATSLSIRSKQSLRRQRYNPQALHRREQPPDRQFMLELCDDELWISVWRTNSLTLGKSLFQIRVTGVHENHAMASCGACDWLWNLNAESIDLCFLQYFIHRNRRCVHDRITVTIAVKEQHRTELSGHT
jgi:hypothetical protein